MKSPSESLPKKFGKRLVYLRQKVNLTQEQLAEISGVSVDFISLLERGLRSPSFVTLERLSKSLDIEVKMFFDFDED